MVALLLLPLLAFSLFFVEPDETGVVLRMGRFRALAEPGLHLKAPLGIDQIVKLPTARHLRQELGLRGSRFTAGAAPGELHALTRELETIALAWTVRYRIADPVSYLFRVRNPDDLLRNLSQAVLVALIGQRSLDELLTDQVGDRRLAPIGLLDDIENEALGTLQQACTAFEAGIEIEQLTFEEVATPRGAGSHLRIAEQGADARRSPVSSPMPFFVLRIGERALVTRFGKPVGEPIETPGWYLKAPFVDQVQLFDGRTLLHGTPPTQATTRDRRQVQVKTLMLWRISDVELLYRRLQAERIARARMDDLVKRETRALVAQRDLQQLVSETSESGAELLTRVSGDTLELGIEVVDARLQQIELIGPG